jgi:ribosomal protein L7/L12
MIKSITVTEKELVDLVSKAVGSPFDEVIVEVSAAPAIDKLAAQIESAVNNYRPFSDLGKTTLSQMRHALNRNVSQISLGLMEGFDAKIAAIKALRCITGLGLVDSKWAVENWAKWIQFVGYHGKFPQINTITGILS